MCYRPVHEHSVHPWIKTHNSTLTHKHTPKSIHILRINIPLIINYEALLSLKLFLFFYRIRFHQFLHNVATGFDETETQILLLPLNEGWLEAPLRTHVSERTSNHNKPYLFSLSNSKEIVVGKKKIYGSQVWSGIVPPLRPFPLFPPFTRAISPSSAFPGNGRCPREPDNCHRSWNQEGKEVVIDIISAYLHTLCVPARPKESTERKLWPTDQSAWVSCAFNT